MSLLFPPRRPWAVLLACAALLAACSRAETFRQEAYVFGTRVEVTVHGGSHDEARRAVHAVLREFDRLHTAFHAWQPSGLTRLNEAIARGERIEVTEELAMLLRDAQNMAVASDGLFEPALGRLIALWGFHTDEFIPALPDAVQLSQIVDARPRMTDVQIDGLRISSSNPAVQIDLGGYLKGYALDRAADILRGMGIRDALINIGGNVMALGTKGGQPWRIGIQHPREPRPLAIVPLYDGEAIGTSGDYQRYFEVGGERYIHLLDPRTGHPARGTQALTVLITPRENAGTWSDGPSKPAFIAGDGWREHTRRFGIGHALRVSADGRIEVTRALQARLQWTGGSRADVVVD